MIAAFSRAMAAIVGAEPVHVVEVDVRDRGDAAVPGVGRVEPTAQPDLDERQVDAAARRTSGRRIAVSSSNSVGGPSRRATRSAAAQDLVDEPRERRRVDRPAVDDDPLAVADEVRLGRLADAEAGGPQGAAGQRQDAALAVRARDERAADASCGSPSARSSARVRPRPEPDPEPAAVGQRAQRRRGRSAAVAGTPTRVAGPASLAVSSSS